MGFPSPATDYVEQRLSLDALCNTRAPSVFLFRSSETAKHIGIVKGSLLVVDRCITPAQGAVIVVKLDSVFRLARYRTRPTAAIELLTAPGHWLSADSIELGGEDTMCFGVVTHSLGILSV